MSTTPKINANRTEISVLLQGNENDYICLTDMASYKDKQRTDCNPRSHDRNQGAG